ncbi:RNA polymerase factor sigma-54 [Treponema pectinovorum]|uniref:RNA polymerase factor sigma-54 n=1 Tax=Treponema pectinovorum TaxID=164 RepID=UPI0011CBB529|nr:RNA polymerase factor sigma-54 [Treponema pectinovorum]
MANVPTFSLLQRTSQNQSQKQLQSQKLSQKQLMALKFLSLSSVDLRREIYDTVAKNPALIITKDFNEEGVKDARVSLAGDNLRVSSISKSGIEASDNFQSALESSPDERQTLSEHLLHQFLSVEHSPSQEKLGVALIHNLDKNGFHILEPLSLLDKNDKNQTPKLLEKTIDYIQRLDPEGCCCRNFEESLFVQASIREDAPEAALFILNGHFDLLQPPQPVKILKKISELKKDFPNKTGDISFSLEDIENALSYIKKLEPFPASQFSPSDNAYIQPDVYVEKNEQTGAYSVRANDELLPVVGLSPDFYELSLDRSRVTKSTEKSEKKRSEHRFIMESVRSAKDFMESLQFRKKTLLLACQQIVIAQKDFFEKGPSFLKPLRQKDIASLIGVHEATISRMANEKYLRCDRGLFRIDFFFTNAVGTNDSGTEQKETSSKTAVMYELEQILKEHKGDEKPLSDQKISDLLLEKGIKIARRTVAKYRSQLNIDSSYTRL